MPYWVRRRACIYLRYAGISVAVGFLAYIAFVVLRIRIPDTAAAILSTGITVTLASLLQRQREIEAAQRTEKIAAYNLFADAIFDNVLTPIQKELLLENPAPVMLPNGRRFEMNQEKLTADIMEVGKKITMWGSDDVVKYYAQFVHRFVSAYEEDKHAPMFQEFADVIKRLRQDLGYENAGIGTAEFYRLFGLRVQPVPESRFGWLRRFLLKRDENRQAVGGK